MQLRSQLNHVFKKYLLPWRNLCMLNQKDVVAETIGFLPIPICYSLLTHPISFLLPKSAIFFEVSIFFCIVVCFRGDRGQAWPKKGIHGHHEFPLPMLGWGMARYVVYFRPVRSFGVERLLEKFFSIFKEDTGKQGPASIKCWWVGRWFLHCGSHHATGLELSWHAGECEKMERPMMVGAADVLILQSLAVGQWPKVNSPKAPHSN